MMLRRFFSLTLTALPLLAPAAPAAQSTTETLHPFVLPWDAPVEGVLDLSAWNATPAGAEGYVQVDEAGQFVVGGQRIRFLGVNVTSASNFPEPAMAEAAARRLASFGINSVRFHHMDPAWNPFPLIDYPAGHSRTLHQEAFGRLHIFVDALQRQGIYTNLNLLVSRQFNPTDDFPPEITVLSWKDSHILGFFNEHALELQKEFARQLLTTPGPAGQAPLVENPAVAFIEILNENGIIQKWYEGVVDRLPAVFQRDLETRWNAWLKNQYSSTQQLTQAWGGRRDPMGEIVVESTFGATPGHWTLQTSPAADIRSVSTVRGNEHPVIELIIESIDPQQWEQVSLNARDLRLEPGALYTVSLAASASRETTLYVHLTDPLTNANQRVMSARLGTHWSRHRATFEAPASGRATLKVGGLDAPGTYTLSELRVTKGGLMAGLAEGSSLLDGTVPLVPMLASEKASPTPAVQRDWLRFLVALEDRYWQEMARFLKEDLGYRGIIFGSIISNSPLTVQAKLDSVDGHSYWTHPRFPLGEWDAETWTVAPRSMVTDPRGSTVAGLAQQRAAGKPFTVTEYQHSSPNPFAAEAPIFAAAYGALQNWDGVWFFDYNIPNSADAVADYQGHVRNFFDDSQHPTRLANYLLAAALFRRGDVAAAQGQIHLPLSPSTEIELLRTRAGAWQMPDAGMLGLDRLWALRHRVGVSVGAEGTATAPPEYPDREGIHIADTGQLFWEVRSPEKGLLRIITPQTRIALGHVGGVPVALGDVTVSAQPTSLDGWATIGVCLKEGTFDPATAAHGFIVATARMQNTNQRWKDSLETSLGSEWGEAPTRIETVRGEIVLPVSAARLRAYALDERGQRVRELRVERRGDRAVIPLGAMPTLWYEFVISAN